MFRCSIAAANTDKRQFKFKFYSYVMWTLNWQLACQFFSANNVSYRIVSYRMELCGW